ncbi:MAG TPA: ferritin family protein [Desulfuromonadaceae bacterium]
MCNQEGRGSQKFYEKLAEDATVLELKNLFALMAESWQEHDDALVKMKGNIDSLKDTFKDLQEAACLFKPLMAKRDIAAEQMEQSDAYQHIVTEEEKDVRFYEERNKSNFQRPRHIRGLLR